MQCPNCNENILSDSEFCPHCNHKVAVTVLSQQERDNFNGVTIEDSSHTERERYSSYETGDSPRIKRINLSFGSSSWLGNLVVAAILVAMLFFFLPLLMVVLIVVGAVVIGFWLLRRLLK